GREESVGVGKAEGETPAAVAIDDGEIVRARLDAGDVAGPDAGGALARLAERLRRAARARPGGEEDDPCLPAGRREDDRHDLIRSVGREARRGGITAGGVDADLDEVPR